jgi:hypothetical protein
MVQGSMERQAKRILSKMSRLALVPSKAPIEWIPEVLLWKEKWPGLQLTAHLHLVLRL